MSPRAALAGVAAGLALAACARPLPVPEPGPAAAAPAPPEHDAAWAARALEIDVRDPAEFAAGHDHGALNIQLSWRQLGARIAAYVPDRATPLAVRGASEADAEEAIGILERAGYVDVGFAGEPGDQETLPLMTAAELSRRLAAPDPPLVLDVRTSREQRAGHIEGAVLLDEDRAPAQVAELGLDPGREIAVICAIGWRSSQLASLLVRRGFHHVSNVIDGMAGWRELR